MDWPVSVALAQAVPTLPEGKGLHYEPKFDGSPDTLRCLIQVHLGRGENEGPAQK